MDLILSAIAALLVALLVLEFQDSQRHVLYWLIHRASRILPFPDSARNRFKEEWLADCMTWPRRVAQLLRALGCVFSAVKILQSVHREERIEYAADTEPKIENPHLVTGAPQEDAPALTQRELDCLIWICQGKTNWEIGQILGISVETVTAHLQNATRKLNAHSKHHAAVKAITLGLIEM